MGEATAIQAAITAQTSEWEKLLHVVTTIEDVPVYPTFLAIKLAFNPFTRFGHHFGNQPITLTSDIAKSTRDALTSAFGTLFAIPPKDLMDGPPERAALLRLYTPARDGGVGWVNPYLERLIAFTASVINTLPLLVTNHTIGPALHDTKTWSTSSSPTLRDVSGCIHYLADIIRSETRQPSSPCEPDHPAITDVGEAILEAIKEDGSIDLTPLLSIAHKHPQKGLAHHYYPYLQRQHRALYPWTDNVLIAHNCARWPHTGALANAYTVSKQTALNNDEAAFWICHLLVIELPFLGPDPYCSPSCDRVPQPKSAMTPAHNLWGTFRHGYHQCSCPMNGTISQRHDQYLEVIASTLRKYCGILAYTGQYLNKDSYSNKSTDLLIVFPGDLHKRPIAIDYRCVCAFLATYRDQAKKSLESVLLPIAKGKEGKHAEHCDGAGRDFMAMPGTTLGSTGHKPFLDIIDVAWSRAIRQNLSGSEGRSIPEEKQAYYARLHAVLIRYTAYHIKTLSGNT